MMDKAAIDKIAELRAEIGRLNHHLGESQKDNLKYIGLLAEEREKTAVLQKHCAQCNGTHSECRLDERCLIDEIERLSNIIHGMAAELVSSKHCDDCPVENGIAKAELKKLKIESAWGIAQEIRATKDGK